MSRLSNSLIIIAILAAYIAVFVFAVDVNTKNNVCDISDKQLFNGSQNRDGECVTTVMGEVPDVDHMVSSLVVFPTEEDTINENEPFTIRTKSINLATGFFDDPATQYYLFPQTLDKDGFIQGHSHVTVQKFDDRKATFDPKVFAFFKGLNDPADGNGELTALVDKGLPAGKYRLCTMVSSFGHQPTLMPVAQRGSQDDCVRFNVVKR